MSDRKFPLTDNQRRVLKKCGNEWAFMAGENKRTLTSLIDYGFISGDCEEPEKYRLTDDGRAEALKL